MKRDPGRIKPICRPYRDVYFRLQLAENKLLLDDSYNANVGSMTAAVQVLSEMPGYRVMVVGDMAELGDEAKQCHRRGGRSRTAAGIDKVLSVGR